jgi:glycosyltransferase involved in cell wall biosynthesis
MTNFSVLLPVYHRDSPEYFAQCLNSLEAQTRPASEILIVKDGPLGSALEDVIKVYSAKLPVTTLQLPENGGLGPALRAGVEKCRFEIIARMDADDICTDERFELEIGFLEAHPEVDVLSGTIREFNLDPEAWISERRLPREHASIVIFAKRRNPVNHMAVVFRKSAVLAAGNYPSRPGFEDYALWVQMLLNGSRFHNLETVCMFARCGNGMHQRRGGWSYVLHEASLFWHFRSLGFLSTPEALCSIGLRLPVRLVPVVIRSSLYRLFARSSGYGEGVQQRRNCRTPAS